MNDAEWWGRPAPGYVSSSVVGNDSIFCESSTRGRVCVTLTRLAASVVRSAWLWFSRMKSLVVHRGRTPGGRGGPVLGGAPGPGPLPSRGHSRSPQWPGLPEAVVAAANEATFRREAPADTSDARWRAAPGPRPCSWRNLLALQLPGVGARLAHGPWRTFPALRASRRRGRTVAGLRNTIAAACADGRPGQPLSPAGPAASGRATPRRAVPGASHGRVPAAPAASGRRLICGDALAVAGGGSVSSHCGASPAKPEQPG